MQSNAARAGLLVALAAIAVVLFVVLNGGDDSEEGSDSTEAAAAATATVPAEPPTPVLAVTLEDGAPVGGVAELEVTKGDEVKIAVRSDEDGDLHVHGYELERELTAGKVTKLSFRADIDGKFEIEAHSHATGDIPLAELTVQPG